MVRRNRAKLVLQLRAEGLSGRAIAVVQGMSRKSIAAVLEAADLAGMGWDDVADLLDAERCMRGCSGAGVSTRACSPNRTGNASTGRWPGGGDVEAPGRRVRRRLRDGR